MSRYVVADNLHYIGGVDKFDVLFSITHKVYVVKWGTYITGKCITGKTLSRPIIRNPQHLQHFCRDSGMTADQALRISLLVKLFETIRTKGNTMTKMLKPLAAEPPSRAWEFFSYILRYPAPMNHAYNPPLDRYLRTAINLGMIEWYGEYHLKLGDHLIWIQNYPYAYGTLAVYSPNGRHNYISEGRPSFEVIRRLRKLEKLLRPSEAAPYPTL